MVELVIDVLADDFLVEEFLGTLSCMCNQGLFFGKLQFQRFTKEVSELDFVHFGRKNQA